MDRLLTFTILIGMFTAALSLELEPMRQLPKTPVEAYKLASEPMRRHLAEKEPTLEGNIRANKEQEKLASKFLPLFRAADWNGEELWALSRLAIAARQHPRTEEALLCYLMKPAPDKVLEARSQLLYALCRQKKFEQAQPIVEQLLAESKPGQDLLLAVGMVIDGLLIASLPKAIVLAERRLPLAICGGLK